MKTIIFIVIIAFAAADYDLDKIDMNDIFNNTAEFKTFVDCTVDKGECSKTYSKYKDVITEAVEQACKKCSPYQKLSFFQFLQGMKAKFPSDYDNFKLKYDPEKKYFDALQSELKKYSNSYCHSVSSN